MEEKQTITTNFIRHGIKMETTSQDDFALALKTWRLRSGITQQEVAKRWGVSRYTIMRAENAKNVSWEMAYRLFAALADELKKEGGTEG